MASFLLKLVWSWRSHWWLRTMPLLAHAQPMCCISQVYFSHVYFSGVFFKCIPQVYFSGILFKCIPGCALVGQCLYSLMHNPRCATCINPIGSTNWPFQRTQRQEQIWFWFTEQINGGLRPNRINWGGSKRPTPTFCKSVIHANFVWTPNASSKMIRRWKTWSFKFYFNLFCFRYISSGLCFCNFIFVLIEHILHEEISYQRIGFLWRQKKKRIPISPDFKNFHKFCVNKHEDLAAEEFKGPPIWNV